MLQFPLREDQERAVQVASRCLLGQQPPTLLSSPTGSGKGLIEAALLEAFPDAAVTCPNQAIAVGIAVKLTSRVEVMDWPEAKQQAFCERLRIFTAGRAKNLAGRGEFTARRLIDDEAHHVTDDTHDSLRDLLGDPPRVGFTATPYRGTPQGTDELRALYPGGIVPVITLKECVDRGYVSLPRFETLPLLDDERIAVKNGEFVVTEVDSAIRSRVGQLCEVIRQREWGGQRYRRPVTVVLGSVGAVEIVRDATAHAGLPTESVTAETTNRGRIFAKVLAGECLLLQVRAVGEGVDLPLRVMYDLSPTMSPVLWMQRLGRIMRPVGMVCDGCGAGWLGVTQLSCPCGGGPMPGPMPDYVACCHNLMRHGYLMEGLVPKSAFVQARQAWGDDWKPSRRSMSRALGNTGFGRFQPVEVPLHGGGTAWLYALRTEDGLKSYAALLLPQCPAPMYFERCDVLTGERKRFVTPTGHEVEYAEKRQGPWRAIAKLPDLDGCASHPSDPAFPSMVGRWKAGAKRYGLDAAAVPNRKQYLLFRILQDTRQRVV